MPGVHFFAEFNYSVKLRTPRPCVRLSSPGRPGPVWGGGAGGTFPSAHRSDFPFPLNLSC